MAQAPQAPCGQEATAEIIVINRKLDIDLFRVICFIRFIRTGEMDMTKQDLTNRIAKYRRALMGQKITAKEFDGLIEALAKIANEEGA